MKEPERGSGASAWAVALLVAAVPLVYRTPSDGIFGSGFLGYYLWTDLVIGLAGVGLLIRGRVLRPDRSIALAIGVLLIIQYGALAIGLVRDRGFQLGYLGTGSTWVRAWLILVLATTAIRHSNDTRLVVKLAVIGFVGVLAVTLAEVAGVSAVREFLNAHYGTEIHLEAARRAASGGLARATSTFDRNPHGLALYMMLAIVGLAAFTVIERPRRALPGIVLFLLAAGFALLTTISTLGVGATMVALGVVVASTMRGRPRAGATFAVFLATICALAVQSEIVARRFGGRAFALLTGDLTSAYLASLTDRLASWRDIVETVSRNWSFTLFGVGPEGLVTHTATHEVADSDYVYVLLTTGLMGLLGFLLALGIIIHRLRAALGTARARGDQTGEVLSVWALAGTLGLAAAGVGGPFFTSEAFVRVSVLWWFLVVLAVQTAGRETS